MTPTHHQALLAAQALLNETCECLDDATGAAKIDWTNLKKLFAALLAQLVPILLPLIINLLDPPPEETK